MQFLALKKVTWKFSEGNVQLSISKMKISFPTKPVFIHYKEPRNGSHTFKFANGFICSLGALDSPTHTRNTSYTGRERGEIIPKITRRKIPYSTAFNVEEISL